MKQDYYKYEIVNDCLLFRFESKSVEKTIEKIITYTPFPDNPEVYNLALGDILKNGEVSDLSVSSNDDMQKVMATVVRTMLRFFEKHPDNFVYFKGSTPERTRLYRIIISRDLLVGKELFDIYGVIGENLEEFIANKPYDAFVIALKSKKDLLKLLHENQ